MSKLVFALILTATVHAESLPIPSPSQILRVQEREARERRMAGVATIEQKPEATVVSVPLRLLTQQERSSLRHAIDRFIHDDRGVMMADAATGSRLERIAAVPDPEPASTVAASRRLALAPAGNLGFRVTPE